MTPTVVVDHHQSLDGDDVTEISHLDVEKVSGVRTPANGTPFLLIKSMADSQSDWIDAAKSDSAESDAIEAIVTGEGDVPFVQHPATGRFMTRTLDSHSAANVAEATKALDELMARDGLVTQPELDTARERVARAALAAVHTRPGRATKSAATPLQKSIAENIARLRVHYDSLPDGAEYGSGVEREQFMAKQTAGMNLTRVQLAAKSIYDDQLAATHALVTDTVAAMTRASASLGGVSSEEQVRAIGSGSGTPRSLGAVSPVGNRGNNLGEQGKGEPEPVAQLRALEDEWQVAGAPVEKERLNERLLHLRLKMSRAGYTFAKAGNGGDAQPALVGHVSASDVNAVGGDVNSEYVNTQAQR
jgi:hypothetical protein